MIKKLSIVLIFTAILLIILGFSKIVPYAETSGIYLFLLGSLLFGLSYISKPDAEENVKPLSGWQRISKIFYAPLELFKNLRSHPRWIFAVLLIALVSGAYKVAFVNRVTPERITDQMIEEISESGVFNESINKRVKKDIFESVSNPVSLAGYFIKSFVETSFYVCFWGLVFLLVISALGGQINYWQAVSVAAYSAVPLAVIQNLTSLIILYLKDPMYVHPILGQEGLFPDNLSFLVQPEASPVLFTLLGYLSLLGLYWLWLSSTGLHKAGQRVSPTMGWIAGVTAWLLGLIFNLAYAGLFGS